MKPLNLDNRPCSPISSNCVIWQGPDIPCIKLCTGDTISDVVFKLATELCTIMDQLKVSNYDLSCLNLNACPPEDFKALIQLLIDKICELNGIPTTTEKSSGCPDCVISVAPCFVQGTTTTMQLVDYVQMIANRICSILDDIATINSQINNIIVRIEALEEAPVPVTPVPVIPIKCTIGSLSPGSYGIDVILNQLINNAANGYCAYINVLGTPAQIGTSLVPACLFGTDVTTNPNWTASPATLAQSLTNVWIVLCELYDIVTNASLTVQDTTTVNLTYTSGTITAAVQDTGWVNLMGFSYMSGYTNARPQCRRIGNQVVFRGVVQIPMGNLNNGSAGFVNPVNEADAYKGLMYGRTYDASLVSAIDGPDACVIDYPPTGTNINEGRSLQFYRGQRVIPASVLPSGVDFDRDYAFGNRQFVFRGVNISDSGVILSTIINVFVTEDGKLGITAPYGVENYLGNYKDYSSMQRNVVSNILSGANVPLYDPTAPSINNATGTATYNANIDGSALTWPFTMNCMSAAQLGGFSIRLDGLVAYISPCVTTIPTPTPCPVG